MFYTFRRDVLPYMLDVFDADVWAVMIPQASQVYPSVWHGAMATAAVRSLLLTKERGGELYGYALFHCNMAIQQIIAIDPSLATPADQEMVLLTCILLICYAMLCSNHYEAFTHIRNGLYLSKMWQLGTRQQGCVSTGTSVSLRFRRLESMTICAPCRLAEPASSRYNLDLLISPDVPFESSTEAYLELLLVDVEWKRFARMDGIPLREMTLRFIVPECELLRIPFRTWQKKYHSLRAWQNKHDRLGDQRQTKNAVEAVRRSALKLLELTLEALTCVDTTAGEAAWDEYTSNFDRIVKLASHMLDEQGEAQLAESSTTALLPHGSQFRSLLGLPLVAVGILCRQPDLRRRGAALLRTVPFLDGLYDQAYFADLIEEQIRIEEQGLLLEPIEGGCDCVLGHYICAAHRVAEAALCPKSAILRTGYDLMHGRTGVTISVAGACTSWVEELSRPQRPTHNSIDCQ